MQNDLDVNRFIQKAVEHASTANILSRAADAPHRTDEQNLALARAAGRQYHLAWRWEQQALELLGVDDPYARLTDDFWQTRDQSENLVDAD